MFRSVGSSVPASLRRKGVDFGTNSRQATFRGRAATVVCRELSGFIPAKRTTALRSWKGRRLQRDHNDRHCYQTGIFLGSSSIATRINQSSRFTPLEDLLLDAMAWMVAFSLWYIPNNVEFDVNGRLGDGDNCDAQLEYREDYGPTVSQWPSKPSSPGRKGNGNSKNPKAKDE